MNFVNYSVNQEQNQPSSITALFKSEDGAAIERVTYYFHELSEMQSELGEEIASEAAAAAGW